MSFVVPKKTFIPDPRNEKVIKALVEHKGIELDVYNRKPNEYMRMEDQRQAEFEQVLRESSPASHRLDSLLER